MEQNVGRVLHDAGKGGTKLLADPCRTIRLRRLIERERAGGRRKLIGRNLARRKDTFRDGDGRYCICPAGIEREMGDDFRDFGRLHAVVECQIEIVRQLNRLIARNQRGDRNDTAIPRIEAGTFPYFAEKPLLRVFIEGGLPPGCPHGLLLSVLPWRLPPWPELPELMNS